MKKILLITLWGIVSSPLLQAADMVSVAGLYPLENSGRVIYNFNQGWRFARVDDDSASSPSFDDSRWETVCAPHTVMLVPSEASGGRNYQGVCWYRKWFTVPDDMRGKIITVHFEAIMGKQVFYVNGGKVEEHLGGYLPVTIDLTKQGVKAGGRCLIAVKADNSDDNSYPPGKKQSQLDFCYHGGMYRDVWLIGKNAVAITDAIEADKTAGGGVFIHYDNISEKSADMFINVEVGNRLKKTAKIPLTAVIKDSAGRKIRTLRQSMTIPAGGAVTAMLSTRIKDPHLWSPETPYLYTVELSTPGDGGMIRTGVRKAEFRGKDGFWLNGRPYRQLIGGNRHQDFAYVGNAVPNSQQWRDAKRLKDAGMNIVRAAHYPQDPAFMDALDELGLFIIVPTPGWQYWNKDPEFAALIYKNTRDIIRRDRNHPCVLMWEPILNETRYPADFSLKSLEITREEYPYAGCPVSAADMRSAGVADAYDVLYGWPSDVEKGIKAEETGGADKCVFTREFGEYVDDWYAHNAINRSSRGWGEKSMLDASLSLIDTYGYMFKGQRQFIGGCQWHPFDHQRGYHPDPYYGGIYDAFRQKKYAFEAFRSQDSAGEPMVFIANEMTPSSGNDVVVFTNCDSVRLTYMDGRRITKGVGHSEKFSAANHDGDGYIPKAPVVFEKAWNFWQARDISYKKREWQDVKITAEGIKDGKVVVTETKMPSRRETKIHLYVDSLGKGLTADGSDFIVVVAEVTDDNGNVRRQAKDEILFTVKGEGHLIGEETDILANPRSVEWGSAPILIQSTNTPGDITITAAPYHPGVFAPESDTITITTAAAAIPACYDPLTTNRTYVRQRQRESADRDTVNKADKKKMLEEVERQQADFGVKN